MVRCFPHTQFAGKSGGCHPYLRHRASLKAPLCRAKPCSAMGRADSQLDAPFSLETSSALFILIGSLLDSSMALFFSCCQDLYEKLLCIVDTAFLLKIKFYLSIYLSRVVSWYCEQHISIFSATRCNWWDRPWTVRKCIHVHACTLHAFTYTHVT